MDRSDIRPSTWPPCLWQVRNAYAELTQPLSFSSALSALKL